MNYSSIVRKLEGRPPDILGIKNFTKFSILIPLIEKEDGIHVLFEVRAQDLRRQPGEICFPGGKMEHDDQNEKQTAIRETVEELNISENDILKVLPMDYMVSPFGTIIYPFIGFLSNLETLTPASSEVESVFTVPLSFFKETLPDCHRIDYQILPESGFPFHLIAGGENYKWQTRKMDELFYTYDGRVIWGMTARLIRHFVEIMNG